MGAYEINMANRSVDESTVRELGQWQLRLERWRHVRHLLDRAELGSGRLRLECLQAAASELTLLALDESLWEYPSASRVSELRRILTDAELSVAAAEAREIVAALERTA
ncbi:MAG: hypothetical protein JWM53_6212 [bacterium]|nr:hypothetical protein [bacterium]